MHDIKNKKRKSTEDNEEYIFIVNKFGNDFIANNLIINKHKSKILKHANTKNDSKIHSKNSLNNNNNNNNNINNNNIFELIDNIENLFENKNPDEDKNQQDKVFDSILNEFKINREREFLKNSSLSKSTISHCPSLEKKLDGPPFGVNSHFIIECVKEKIVSSPKLLEKKSVMEIYSCLKCNAIKIQEVIVPVAIKDFGHGWITPDNTPDIQIPKKDKIVSSVNMECSVDEALTNDSSDRNDYSQIDCSIDEAEARYSTKRDTTQITFSPTLESYLMGEEIKNKTSNVFICNSCAAPKSEIYCKISNCDQKITRYRLCKKHIEFVKETKKMSELERQIFYKKIDKHSFFMNKEYSISSIISKVDTEERCEINNCRGRYYALGCCEKHYKG